MAKINFPNSPTLDQEHIVGDRTWKWNGRSWIAVLGLSSETTLTPTITYISKTESSITFTITNNDEETAIVLYSTDDGIPEFAGVELLTGATSASLTIDGLDALTEYTIYASAVAATKLLSEQDSFTETTLERTATPTIAFVSKTDTQIVFTITNNDADEVEIKWEQNNTNPAANTLTLAAGVTSSDITLSGLTAVTEYIIYANAKSATKALSLNDTITVTTDEPPTYIEATGGTVLDYTDGGTSYRSHTFTTIGNSNFVVNSLSNQSSKNEIDYLIIAGGGGGGGTNGAGGGAGGYRTTVTPTPGNTTPNAKIVATLSPYPIVVGTGGTGTGQRGNSGNNSSAFSITATGGGGGGACCGNTTGLNGGSGGGQGGDSGGSVGTGISGQGFNGGFGITASNFAGGGGGGASAVGGNSTTSISGAGGNGLVNNLRTGSNETRAGGGSGGTRPGFNVSSGGIGGGGTGSVNSTGGSGTVNTGGGGGGGAYTGTIGEHPGGSGGSGIVIIRYEIAPN